KHESDNKKHESDNKKHESDNKKHESDNKKHELTVFLFVAVVLAPILATVIVGGYGFVIWIYQLIVGPPGPPIG
ncbi:MAG: periplasmic nitrate reductase, NapE protein, partial [Acidiferrobacterales bacterium]